MKTRNDYWVLRDKSKVLICCMEKSHIENCIRMIRQNPGWRTEFLKVLEEELAFKSRKLTKLEKVLA